MSKRQIAPTTSPRRLARVSPLVSGATAYAAPSASVAGESEPESAVGGEDPLVRNGLASPLCRHAAAELSALTASDCETSGFTGAGAPSQNYSFDTNIDTTFGVSIDALLQDYLVRPAWMGLVWLVHALVVALEWSYEIELLGSTLTSGLSRGLIAAEAQFTRPWLASALAFAAILAAYHGLVRRQVAETLGEVAAMLAMIASAMFVIADPSGTIGALSQWANGASVGTYGAVADGSATHPYAALANGMHELYEASIEAPWCFLEFGDVSWCDTPARLDPRLHSAALRIAGQIEAEASASAHRSGAGVQALANRAQLLRRAQTNGQIFLALPANGPLRNSVKEAGSLLFVLCGGGEDARSCKGPTAAEAEFRANAGTLPRLGGVLVIALVVLGMLVLFAYIAARLLEAAVISMFFLLLAPVAALAPTLGEAGRAVFRSWAARLLGVVTAKLIWSVLLGALLATTRVVLSLQGLGWLMQWSLVGVLWWGAFFKRRGLLDASKARGPRPRPTLMRRVSEQAAMGFGREAGRTAWRKLFAREPGGGQEKGEHAPGRDERAGAGPAISLIRRLSAESGADGDRSISQASSAHATGVGGGASGTGGLTASADLIGRTETTRRAPSEAAQARRPRFPGAAADATTSRASSGRSHRIAARNLSFDPRQSAAAQAPGERLQRLRAEQAKAIASGDLRRAASLSLRQLRVEEQAEPHARSDNFPATARGARDAFAEERAMRDPVMRDALEVARGRKRQLGWSWREGEE